MATPALTFVLIKRLSNLRLILLYLVKDLMEDFYLNECLHFPLCLWNATHISLVYFLCFIYLYEGEGWGGGGCPMAPCYHYVLGSRKTGSVRGIFVFECHVCQSMFTSCICCIHKILFIKKKFDFLYIF